jgi:hypothetical protein
LPSAQTSESRRDALFFILIAVGIAVRLVLEWFAPPLLDIYYYDAQAVQAMIHGLNPYGYPYTGIPSWLSTPGASNVFVYLPGVPLFLLPFGAVWDVRVGLIVADLVVALTLWGTGGTAARRASLLFFLLPSDWLFSTSYPNNTLVAMCFLGVAALLDSRGRRTPSAVSLGAALASSQFIWLVYPIFAYRYLKRGFRKEVLVSLAVAAAIVAPFFFWSPASFLSNAILFQFSRPVQHLVTPMAFGFNVNPTLNGLAFEFTGSTIPLYLRAPAEIAALALAIRWSGTERAAFLNATWFLLLSFWLLPNDFSPWYLELPFQTLLIWWALGSSGASSAASANP